MDNEEQPLSEAVGGSLAATLSVAAFYPLEVLRVHLQTGGSAAEDAAEERVEASETVSGRWKRMLRLWQRVVFNKAAGLRMVHTQLTAFMFYGLYRHIGQRYFAGKNKGAWANVLSSTSAAMLTVLVVGTPLDGVILRLQTQQETPRSALSLAPPLAPVEPSLYETVIGLYKGITPALLLCLNPAIHFTVFDSLKLAVLNATRPAFRQTPITYTTMHRHRLSAGQAFLVGAVAKALATVVCYPLLRAKVDLMTMSSNGSGSSPSAAAVAAAGTIVVPSACQTTTATAATRLWSAAADSDLSRLFRTLYAVLRVQGLGGLYRGFLVHLVHTTMRSALSMALKERLVAWVGKLLAAATATATAE